MIAYANGHVVAAKSLVAKIQNIILTPLIELMLAVALLMFLWGMYEYVMGADNETTRAKGQKHMLFGIIGLVVMLSALAILKIAAGTFGVSVPE